MKRLSVDEIILKLKQKGISVTKKSVKVSKKRRIESYTIDNDEEVLANVSEAELRGFAMNRGIE